VEQQIGCEISFPLTDEQDDCYYTELAAIIDVADGKADRSIILSPYEDAIKTYELVSSSRFPIYHWTQRVKTLLQTWAIRKQGETEYQARQSKAL
jgi:hypothetical protein